MMKKIIIVCIAFLLFPYWSASGAEELQFEARIIEITNSFVRVENTQTGERHSIESSFDIAGSSQYHEGDKILVNHIIMEDGSQTLVIVDMVRGGPVLFLVIFFVFLVILVGGKQGVRSLFSLCLTFIAIIFVIIPLILKGWNPVFVVAFGGSIAMLFAIYITHGFNRKSHASYISLVITLLIASIASAIFVRLTSLTGFVHDEATFLVILGYTEMDMRGVLLAAILIGSLGVMDDLIVSQVSLVKELKETNPSIEKRKLFRSAFRVGRDHISSMVNTLFLAYAGTAFHLLILFYLQNPPFDSIGSILNNEIVATEIIRTLTGSIALLLSMPIATWIGVRFYQKKI